MLSIFALVVVLYGDPTLASVTEFSDQVVYEDANTSPWSSHTEEDDMDFAGGEYAPQTAFTELMANDEEQTDPSHGYLRTLSREAAEAKRYMAEHTNQLLEADPAPEQDATEQDAPEQDATKAVADAVQGSDPLASSAAVSEPSNNNAAAAQKPAAQQTEPTRELSAEPKPAPEDAAEGAAAKAKADTAEAAAENAAVKVSAENAAEATAAPTAEPLAAQQPAAQQPAAMPSASKKPNAAAQIKADVVASAPVIAAAPVPSSSADQQFSRQWDLVSSSHLANLQGKVGATVPLDGDVRAAVASAAAIEGVPTPVLAPVPAPMPAASGSTHAVAPSAAGVSHETTTTVHPDTDMSSHASGHAWAVVGKQSSSTAAGPVVQTMPPAVVVTPEPTPDLTLDPSPPPAPMIIMRTPAPAPVVVPVPGEVPLSDQGNRAAQDHMLKVVHDEMNDSFPGAKEHESKLNSQQPSEDDVKGLVDDSSAVHGLIDDSQGRQSDESGQGKVSEDMADDEDTASDIEGGFVDPQEEAEAEARVQAKLVNEKCASARQCEKEAQKHIQASGEAFSRASMAHDGDDEANEMKWKNVAHTEKEQAVAATIEARTFADSGGNSIWKQKIRHTLASAAEKEKVEKKSEAQSRAFKKKVVKEGQGKAAKKLSHLHRKASDADLAEQDANKMADEKRVKAIRARVHANKDDSVDNRIAAESKRSEANMAFGYANEAKHKATEKESEADKLGTQLEASKIKAAGDAACKAGEKMALDLCSVSFHSSTLTCKNPAVEDDALMEACLEKADKQRLACQALAAGKRNQCEEFKQSQVYGDSIMGYEVRINAAMAIETFTQQVDYDLRKAVAERCGVTLQDVITMSVKDGPQIQISLAIAGTEIHLRAKVNALLSSFMSGKPVGGVQTTDAALRFQQDLKLPGQKPQKWVSEKAEKAWHLSQEETRKLMGTPAEGDVREVNVKAHSNELNSKRLLANDKTKSAQLKRTATEMETKVEAKKAVKAEEDEVQEAQAGLGMSANVAVASQHSDLSSKGMDGDDGMSDSSTASSSGSDSYAGDFTVIRDRYWSHQQNWLKSKYSLLYDLLKKAKAAGNDAGDDAWKRYLLNYFYTKNRELKGYRFGWNADGSYTPKRYLVVGCRRYLSQSDSWETGPTTASGECGGAQGRNVYSVSIRSVNNLCYPGVRDTEARDNLPAGGGALNFIDTRAKACSTVAPVSVRLSRFRLVKPPREESTGMMTGTNGAPAMYLLRAYRAISPSHYARPFKQFAQEENEGMVGVHRVKWTINMVAEYCEAPMEDGTATPYDESKSWPRKMFETGKMKWNPIVISKAQKRNSDMMLTVLRLQTDDKKMTITCRSPQVAGVVNGKFLTPVDTKCDIKVARWQYSLDCPPGKVKGLAFVTSVMTRYDDSSMNPEDVNPSSDPDVATVETNAMKTTLKFQKTAELRVLQADSAWQNRGSVQMRMKVSDPHWIPSTQFQSHRHYTFSFGMQNMDQIGNSELNWDPQLTSNFQQKHTKRELNLEHTVETLHKQPKITILSFLGITNPVPMETKSNACTRGSAWGLSVLIIPVVISLCQSLA